MTTFQDPQPQSRRAVRQNERAETTDNGFVPFPPNQGATPPGYYSDPDAAREMWDTTARRATQAPPAAPRTEATTGRRAAPVPPPTAEPMTYATQSRSPVPSYDGPTFQAQPTPLPEAPPQDASQYRVRDFSPEGRRAAQAASMPQASAPAAPSDLQYHTEARLPSAPQPVAAPQPVSPVPEQTMSRRELRAMQQAEQDAATTAQPAYPAPAAYEPAPAHPAPAAYQPPAQPQAAAYQPPVAEEPSAFDALFRSNPAPQALPPVAPEPQPNTGLTNALAEYDALSRSQQAAPVVQAAPVSHAAPVSQAAPATWTPPTGHWAAQLQADDEPFGNTLSRSIGSGHTATNALVLPGMPKDTDIRGPLTSTGEVMLTGSIDLPRSLASTGATATMEHDGIDALFDANDTEINSTDSSPVRAIRAVSTHHSGHGVTHTQKPKGTKALTVLLVAASSMAVVVAGLLIAAFAFNVF